MLGHSHAMSGLAAGAFTLPLVQLSGPVEQVAWVAAWGGFSMLPDLDQGGIHWKRGLPRTHGSNVARMWGPVTTTIAGAVGKVAKGHRNGTHDVILAPLAFGVLAALASLNRWTSLVFLAFALGLALRALAPFIPGNSEKTVIGNLVLSFGGAWFLTSHGVGAVEWLPVAVAGGVIVHIVGDWLTVGGVPVPLTWFDGKAKRVALKAFRTGSPVETVVAAAFVLVALGGLYLNTGLGPAVEPVVAAVLAQAAT